MQSSTEPVLLQQQIAFETVQPGIGKELFPLIGPGGPARQHFDDQAGAGAVVRVPIIRVTADHQVGVIENLRAQFLEMQLDVGDEYLTRRAAQVTY